MPNLVDAILGGLIALSGLAGLRRGLAREALSLAVWGTIFLAALFVSDFTALAKRLAGEQLSQAPSLLIFFMFLVFLLAVGAAAGMLFRQLIRTVGLGDVDRAAGALFGIFRGVVVMALVAIYLPPLVALDRVDAWRESRVAAALVGMEDALSRVGMRLHDSLRELSDTAVGAQAS